MALINRDPFAREEIHRETIETNESCKFCGNTRKSGKLFWYYILRDRINNRRANIGGFFCSISCMRAYHNH